MTKEERQNIATENMLDFKQLFIIIAVVNVSVHYAYGSIEMHFQLWDLRFIHTDSLM